MPSEQSALSKTVFLANRLEEQIKKENLSAGDSFFSTQEASKFLGVAGVTANRALRLLEKRGVIIRKQRRGAIIAGARKSNPGFFRIHFLLQKFYLQAEGFDFEEVLLGLQEEHPEASVENFFPDEGLEELQTTRLIEKCLKGDRPEGFVLARAPFVVMHMIENSGLPAALYGTRPVGVERLPMIDYDHVSAIRLVHEHLRRRGCRKMVYVMRNLVLPGDVGALNYINRISDMETSIRFASMHDLAVDSLIHDIVSKDDAPDILVCHTKQIAISAAKVIRDEGKSSRVVILDGCDQGNFETYREIDAMIVNDIDQQQIGRRIGRILTDQLQGEKNVVEIIPVRLITRK